MITPQLVRCRQCKAYLHGVGIEGAVLDGIIPEAFQHAPGTFVMLVALFGYYALMVMFAGVDSVLGLSPYALRQLGATYSIGVIQGEYWRFATSMLGHAGIGHLFFNLYALTIVGPLIEEIYDRKKMLVIFIVGGVLSMAASYVWNVEIRGALIFQSVGASGGISALIGACLFGARRKGSGGQDVAQVMTRWSVYMLLIGFAGLGIDNVAHLSGWLVGAGLAMVLPFGVNATVTVNRIYSVAVFGLLAGLLVCVGFMLADVRAYGARLEADVYSRRFLFFTYHQGKPVAYSSQNLLLQKCEEAARTATDSAAERKETIEVCERAYRANLGPPQVTFAVAGVLVGLHALDGNAAAAARYDRVLDRMRK